MNHEYAIETLTLQKDDAIRRLEEYERQLFSLRGFIAGHKLRLRSIEDSIAVLNGAA